MSDSELLAQGVKLCKDDQYLAGARVFDSIKDKSLLEEEHLALIARAGVAQKLRTDLTEPLSEGWTKQGESHGSRDFITYYKIEDGGKLKCRIESVIESSLFVPFLATMNETQLYDTWFPRWSFPFKLGIHRSAKLKQVGRVEQVVQMTVDLPFPLKKREIVFNAFSEEDCASSGTVGAKLVSVQEGYDNGLVPAPDPGVVRMSLGADFLFHPCEQDHPALEKSTAVYPEGEGLILLTCVMYIDPKIAFVPQAFLNFATRTAIGSVWRMILRIAEEVRDGKRPAHADLIKEKREELYDWVEERATLITGIEKGKMGI